MSLFLSSCVQCWDSNLSALYRKCIAVPGVLPNKFTMYDQPYIWSVSCDANISKSKIENSFSEANMPF